MRAAELPEKVQVPENHCQAAPPPAPGDGIMGPHLASAPQLQVTPFQASCLDSPGSSQQWEHVRFTDISEEAPTRRQWMSRMDFPRFDGTDASIWVDTCETFFRYTRLHPGFRCQRPLCIYLNLWLIGIMHSSAHTSV